MLDNCFRFAPRDSIPGLIAKICKYLKDHPGWSEVELEEQIRKFISSTGVESFNGRTGIVTLDKNDVNNLKIASAYFAEGDESIDSLDLVSLYNQGVRFVFTDFNSVTSGYNLAFVLEYFSGSGNVVYYPMSTVSSGGGNIVSVNGKTGEVNLKVVDVSNGNSPDENAYIFIDESDDYPDVISYDSSKLGGQLPSYYASAAEVSQLKDDIGALEDGMPVQPYQYGVNLLDRMTAQQLHEKVASGDFTGIRNGDYVEVTLNGSFWDYGSYTCPSGTTYYSDTGLATSAGTTSGTLEATFVNDTYCEITVSGTKYYVATSACDDHFVRTLNNAVMKFEANIDFYYKYGDSGLSGGAHHIAFVGRDMLPVLLKMRKAKSAWTDTETDNPWLGSALYKTFNDPDHGILALMVATSIGPYIYAGPNGKGMRFLGEKKAAGAGTATGWTWYDRGKLWVPSEREVWGADVFSDRANCAGMALQMPVFAGSLRHIVKGIGNNGSRGTWWCLSSIAGSSTNFCYVNNGGNPSHASAAHTLVGAPVGFLLT